MDETAKDAFRSYRTPVLFVLVGENPLPNYVAAKLLLEPGGTLCLVHSEGPKGTGDVADRLSRNLSGYQIHCVPVDEHEAESLQKTVRNCLARISAGPLGLNYTGGTKFMAVHVSRTVEEYCEEQHWDLARSYLHADNLELALAPYQHLPAKRRRVVDAVPLSLGVVFALHGLELSDELQTTPRLPNLARTLVEINSEPEGVEAWRTCRKLLFQSPSPPWQEARARLSGAGIPDPAICELEEALGLVASLPASVPEAARRVGFRKPGSLRVWLDGGWLEDWALRCIQELGYTERFRNLLGRIPGKTTEEKARRFEMDVGAMRGYQLFALSCKAGKTWSEAKLGLMEVLARARQMGGEEARAALVMTHLDAGAMEQEVSSDWGAGKRIRVFGCKQLSGLKNLLQQWFDEP